MSNLSKLLEGCGPFPLLEKPRVVIEPASQIIAWLERNHTLHRAVEVTYVVDGYQVEITHDLNPIAGPWWGETLEAAYLEAMKYWDVTHGNTNLLEVKPL